VFYRIVAEADLNSLWRSPTIKQRESGHEQRQDAVHAPRSAAIFEKMAIQSAFLEEIYQTENAINGNPLNLFIF
jgi:hypothetical protein